MAVGYAILTTEVNKDIAPYHDRQVAVLRRDQRMAWFDLSCPEDELLGPLPLGSYRVSRPGVGAAQTTLAI